MSAPNLSAITTTAVLRAHYARALLRRLEQRRDAPPELAANLRGKGDPDAAERAAHAWLEAHDAL